MGVKEDIEKAQRKKGQEATSAANKRIIDAIKKRNADLESRQAEAKRSLPTVEIIYQGYITQLSTGRKNNKTLSEYELGRIRTAAETSNKRLTELRKILAQKPEVVKLPPPVKPQEKATTDGPTGTVTPVKEPKVKDTTTPASPSAPIPVLKVKTKAKAEAEAEAEAEVEAEVDVKPKPKTAAEREAEALEAASKESFDLSETLFKNIESLKNLLAKYVNTPGMTPDAFRKMLRDDVWFKQNSKEIRARFVQYYNYRDLQASGRAQGTTDYEMQIDKIEASLKKRAIQIGSAAASDPAALRKAAENLYITDRSEDDSFIDDFLAASIRPVAGIIGGKGTEGYSGQALSNYQILLREARDNGFQISDIIPGGSNEQQVLQGIASGKLDINRILQDARKLAAQGQPQYVRDLLSQGFNLKQVFAPYRNTMAAILEIDDPESIDLNDPVLRSAISDKGDMNIYDFKKALRKDSRWQYTENARTEVADSVLGVLRDFGFQG